MKRGLWPALLCLVVIFPGMLAATATADKGGIPIDPTVRFDESAQNAIVAWNGQKECLILSTDLQSPAPGRLMEMLPLPAAPYDIQLGNTSSFKTIIRLFNEKAQRLNYAAASNSGEKVASGSGDALDEYEGVDIVFSTSVGLHNITVVKIDSQDHFVRWARDFAGLHGASNLSIGEDLNRTVGDHLARGISYFVFDVVDLSVERRTSEPMVYLFNTTYLYYPLRITHATLDSDSRQPNDITIFLVTDGVLGSGVHQFTGVHSGAGIDEFIEFSGPELRSVSGPMAGLFNRSAFVTHYYGTIFGRGSYSSTIDDIVVQPKDLRRPTDAELKAQYDRADFLRAIRPLSPSLAYSMLRSIYDPGYAPPAAYLALILLGIFIAPIVLGLLFKGVMERGTRKGSLWVVGLALYCVGIGGVASVSSLVTYYSGSAAWLLAVYLALLLPLVAALYLGERFKTKPAADRRTVPGLAFGMAAAQVLVFVFVPNSTVAIPIDLLCFPALGIAGLIVIPFALLARRNALLRPPSPPPGPAQKPQPGQP